MISFTSDHVSHSGRQKIRSSSRWEELIQDLANNLESDIDASNNIRSDCVKSADSSSSFTDCH